MNSNIRVFASMFLAIALLLIALAVSTVTAQGPSVEGSPGPAGVTNPTTVLYQGYVTVEGTPYNGTGYFKFAIVNAASDTTYWSNDGTSSGGSQPNASVPISVDNGYFTVLLGDTSLNGMTQSLSPSVFAGAGRYLQVWFATSAPGPFTQLSLLPITAAPYALNAETLDGYDSDAFATADHTHWGEAWLGNGTGLTLYSDDGTGLYSARGDVSIFWGASGGQAIWGDSSSAVGLYGTSDSNYGVYGISGYSYGGYFSSTYSSGVKAEGGEVGLVARSYSASTIRPAVYGENRGFGAGFGVEGYSAGGIGIVGESITGTGVVGMAGYDNDGFMDESLRNDVVNARAGVYGWSSSGYGGYFTSIYGCGVCGTSYDLDGVRGVSTGGDVADNGVYGETNSTDPAEAGVYGYSSSSAAGVRGVGNDIGVYGYAFAITGTTTGGFFQSASDGGRGVYGWTPANTGNTYGVVGDSASSSGTGVFGLASATTATNTGVLGYANGIYTDTAGVKGLATATSGYATFGVYGRSDSSGGAGVMAYNYWYGVGLRAQSYGGDIIQGYSGDPFAPDEALRFRVDNSGNLWASGTKSAMVQTQNYGSRSLYAIESPEVWFEDFGTGQLVNGEATVFFDPIFAQTVSLTETYHVYLTPLSDEAVVLFVTEKGPTSFTVRGVTLDGRPANAAFDYRIVAKRRGYENVRLEPPRASQVWAEGTSRPKSGGPALPPLPERPEIPPYPQEEGR